MLLALKVRKWGNSLSSENQYNKDNAQKPILVLGVGNNLQTDDGVGVHAVAELMKMEWPEEVEIVDGGIAGLDLIAIVDSREYVIVLDAIDAGHPPGTIFKFTPEDISDSTMHCDSLHQIGLLETIQMAKLTGNAPKHTLILGVQPENVDWGLELTRTVQECLPRLILLARQEINNAMDNFSRFSQGR